MDKQFVSPSGVIHLNMYHRWNKLPQTGLALISSTCKTWAV